MKAYQVYAALYVCKNKLLPVEGVKVGHSMNSLKRAQKIMSCMEMQHVFRVKDLSKADAILLEDNTNEELDNLARSGGSTEFHLFHSKQLEKVRKILIKNLGETVDWQPNASTFSHLSVSTVYLHTQWPRLKELRSNYYLSR